ERPSARYRDARRPGAGRAMRLVVVGGGITGLAAAHRALELARERRIALELTLVEARERLGGTIATERTGGFLIEAGPDSFLSEKPWALALCRRLGREALERVAQPLVAGIYTADPDDLSLTATMPRFAELETQERSIILGLRRARRRARETGVSGARWSLFVTLKEGMEELVAALAT